jgi:selenocysteine-specific elongation factor
LKHIVVGTAGHIDHGKTSLVKALTGIDADRLEEEKRRGITIDLGFAHMEPVSGLRLAFVDVPGHERFIKNMLAGVGGIDVVLFVVASDESIKPQTREHFEICRLLGVPRGVVALTKRDLVDPELVDLVRLELEELTAGSFLEGAPMVAVSATTGAGLDDLTTALVQVGREAAEKNAAGHFRLPVDRVFTVKGFGTVVTGTLISGAVAREQEVEIHPLGRRVRVRGVEVHGAPAERAVAGQRTALNLADIEPAELKRGDVLTAPGRFASVRHLDCRVNLLPSAQPLKNRAPVHFHCGTADLEAEVRLLEGRAELKPGQSGYARIVLRDPALLLPGDRFIIRKFSPVVTIGGGVILDIGGFRYRKDTDSARRLEVLASGDAAARLALLVREAPFGMPLPALIARTGLTEREIVTALGAGIAQNWYVDAAWSGATRERLTAAVRKFHQANPMLPGIPKQDLRSAELSGAPPFLLDALLEAVTQLVVDGDTVRLRTHRRVFKEEEEQARAKIEAAFENAGLAAPAVDEVLAKAGLEPARARTLLEILLREKRLQRIGADLVLHRSAIEQLRASLAQRKGTRFQVSAFKEWTGVSRKYAIPLLEFLDREHVTRRVGEERIIL